MIRLSHTSFLKSQDRHDFVLCVLCLVFPAMSGQQLTLMQRALEGNESSKPSRRVLKQRDTDEAASRVIKDRFPKSTALDAAICLVNGVTLLQQLSKDIRDTRGHQKRLTRAYYEQIEAEFMPDHLKTAEVLAVTNNKQSISPALIEGLKKIMAAKILTIGCVSSLIEYLHAIAAMNQLELVG